MTCRPWRWRGTRAVAVRGVPADRGRELAAYKARADQEGEAIEHPLVGDPGLARDQLADPVGEVLVVGHDGIIVAGLS